MSKVKELEKILGKDLELKIEETKIEPLKEIIHDSGSVSNPVVDTVATRPEEKKTATVLPIAIDQETKQLAPKDNVELARIIRMLRAGLAFPKDFDTDEKCLAGYNLATQLCPRAPQRILSRMMIINNVIGIWGEAPKALAEETGELEDFVLFVYDKNHLEIKHENKNSNEEVYGACCKIKRKGRTSNEYLFTMDDARRANLLGKDTWKKYPQTMLRWKALGMGMKFEFPDALMGTELIEYTHDVLPQMKDVTPEKESFESRLEKLKNGTSA